MNPIVLTIAGIPKPQPRSRARRGQKGTYDPGMADFWKALVNAEARNWFTAPLNGPIRVDSTFKFPRPARLNTKKHPEGLIHHWTRPDRDNLDKAVLDALKGVAWIDDAQVCDGWIRKFYHEKNGGPGVIVIITPIHEKGESDSC